MGSYPNDKDFGMSFHNLLLSWRITSLGAAEEGGASNAWGRGIVGGCVVERKLRARESVRGVSGLRGNSKCNMFY